MSIASDAANWALQTAGDNSHGYSQNVRWGPDYDCSSFVISAYESAGVRLKALGASYTGNMAQALTKAGFRDVRPLVNMATGEGMQMGDILLDDTSPHEKQHTAMYVSGGKIVHARSSEGNTQLGDQSGNEIRVQSYYNKPWSKVFRAPGTVVVNTEASTPTFTTSTQTLKAGEFTMIFDTLKYGSKGTAVKRLQQILNAEGYNSGEADGDFGIRTRAAVVAFQDDNDLDADGIAGPLTLKAMFGGR